MYCLDTDVLSAVLRKTPRLDLIRRLAVVPADAQFTTSINLGELLYGASRKGNPALVQRIRDLVRRGGVVLPFDEAAAEVYGPLRAALEKRGQRLDEPDLRIASIALAHDLTLVTGNVRHFARVPKLRVENWLVDAP